jgi:hypothetical protein
MIQLKANKYMLVPGRLYPIWQNDKSRLQYWARTKIEKFVRKSTSQLLQIMIRMWIIRNYIEEIKPGWQQYISSPIVCCGVKKERVAAIPL